MSNLADIAVVITAHNYGHYLKSCLDSVLSQTLVPRQIVVVDDKSEDHAADVVAQYDDVCYCRVDFGNGNRARNFGFLKTRAEYVAFFDADNEMLPNFLGVLYAALKQHKDAAFAYGDRIVFAEGDTSWYPQNMGLYKSGPFDLNRLKKHNYIDLAALIRARCFPGFDPVFRRYQDWDLWLHMALKQGLQGCYVAEPLFRYRVHPQSVSAREDRNRALWAIRRKYQLGWGKIPILRHSFTSYCLGQKIKSLWSSTFS